MARRQAAHRGDRSPMKLGYVACKALSARMLSRLKGCVLGGTHPLSSPSATLATYTPVPPPKRAREMRHLTNPTANATSVTVRGADWGPAGPLPSVPVAATRCARSASCLASSAKLRPTGAC